MTLPSDDDAELYPDEALTTFASLVAALNQERAKVAELTGDATVLRAHCRILGETPSMTASSRDHWKARAGLAEVHLAEERAKSEGLRVALEAAVAYVEHAYGNEAGEEAAAAWQDLQLCRAALSTSPSPTPQLPVDAALPSDEEMWGHPIPERGDGC